GRVSEGTGDTTGKVSRSRNTSSFFVRHPTHPVIPPPDPAATTRPPACTNCTTRASSAAYRLRGGSSTTSSAGGVPRDAVRAKSNSGVRRSEERRVGKECRSRWSRWQYKESRQRG